MGSDLCDSAVRIANVHFSNISRRSVHAAHQTLVIALKEVGVEKEGPGGGIELPPGRCFQIVLYLIVVRGETRLPQQQRAENKVTSIPIRGMIDGNYNTDQRWRFGSQGRGGREFKLFWYLASTGIDICMIAKQKNAYGHLEVAS